MYLYTYTSKHCFPLKKHVTHSGSSENIPLFGWDTDHNLAKMSVNDVFHYVMFKGSY